MLNRELILSFDDISVNVYMLGGFFRTEAHLAAFHNHPFTEIQVVVNGNIHFSNFEENFDVCSGQMIIFPPNVFHESTWLEPGTDVICFQISIPVENCLVMTLPKEIPSLLLSEIRKYEHCGTSIKLPIYLSVIVSELIKKGTDPAKRIQNRSFLIHDFLSENFAKQITISDLAATLCISSKQTERLVKQYTGNTFREEIIRLRMEAAEHLITSTNLTLNEIAEKVGYQSYSGFWKAYNIFKNL